MKLFCIDNNSGFAYLDLYLSDRLEELTKSSTKVYVILMDLQRRFSKGDYGEITKKEQAFNDEQRYIRGLARWLIARYKTDLGTIIYESFNSMSLLYFEDEDISAVRDKQNEDIEAVGELHTPNPETIAAMKEAEGLEQESKSYMNVKDLFDELDNEISTNR